MSPEDVAQLAYEVNRAYAQTVFQNFEPAWELARPEVQQSYRDGIQFVLSHPGAGPDAQHEEWLATRRRAGWVWGEVKSLHNKTSPFLLEYAKLPLEVRAKDAIFQAIVRGCLPPETDNPPDETPDPVQNAPEEGESDV